MRKSRSGLTLVEAIIAMFLLAGGFVVVSRCFHAALRYSTRTTMRWDATLCAQNRLRAMRAWSLVNHHPAGALDMDQWGPYAAGGPTVDPADPRFSITTVITNPTFYDPCTKFEQVVPTTAERFTLTSQRRQITIRVTWGSLEFVDLTTILCAPAPRFSQRSLSGRLALWAGMHWLSYLGPQELAWDLPSGAPPPAPSLPAANLNTCVLQLYQGASDSSPVPINLSHDQTESYNARLQVLSGGTTVEVPARVTWFVVGPGNGTLIALRGGNRVTFRHQVKAKIAAAPGFKYYYTDNLRCNLRATAKYAGLIVNSDTPDITLQP